MALTVGIAGVSGYAGVELLRLLRAHPEVEVTALAAGRAAGSRLTESWPALLGGPDPELLPLDPALLAARCELVFLALPHGVSASVVPALLNAGVRVVDLGADFRLTDPEVYAAAYGPHPCPELLPEAVYGLPELKREALHGARLIACPGCYPTATAIAALPLVEAGLVAHVVTNCLSGVSGAGRKAGARNLYCEVQEQAVAYKIAGGHRHRPEMEQTLGVPVSFTPHLVPMIRGMLATVTVFPTEPIGPEALQALYQDRYADHPMVTVRDIPPATSEVRGTARACVHAAVDPLHGAVTAICAIDNLGKGAAGQAVHAMNLALGFEETLGLPRFPLLP